MPEKSKTYEKSAPRVYIRTFGWPFVSSLQCSLFVLSNSMNQCAARWGGLRWWCMHRSASPWGSASLLRSLGRSLCGHSRVRFGFFVFDFCSVESAQPPGEFHRREAGGWEAESFVEAEVVGYTPPTQQSQSGGFSPSGLPQRPLCVCFPWHGKRLTYMVSL